MELKDFVKNTLVSVMTGVVEARNELKNKEEYKHFDIYSAGYVKEDAYIAFDVAVISKTEGKLKGEGKGQIFVVGVSGSGEISKSNENVSRIKFYVNCQ